MELTTERLRLREPDDRDAETLRDYFRRNDARFAPWDQSRPDDLQSHARWIAEKRDERRSAGHAVFLAFGHAAPDLIAVVALDVLTIEGPRAAALSYTVDELYEGRGYASEAAGRVARYAFAERGFDELLAYYHPDNVRSAKLLEHLRFTIVARTPVPPGLESLMRPRVVAVLRAAAAR
jgi:8-oxo-dGTP diphosphatase